MGLLLERFGTQEFEWLVNGRRVDPTSTEVSTDMRVELRHLNDCQSPPPLDDQSASPSPAEEVGERSVSIEISADTTMELQPPNDFQSPPVLDVQPVGQPSAHEDARRPVSIEIVMDDRVGLRPRNRLRPRNNFQSPPSLDVQPAGPLPADEYAERPMSIEIVMDERMGLGPQSDVQSPPPPVVRRARRRPAEQAAEGSVSSPTGMKRKQHAEVEARYRTSLNLAFYRLGQAISDGRSGRSSQLRKAKLLDSAREFICKLQTDLSVLSEENKRLREMLRVASSKPPTASPLAVKHGPAGESVSEAEESGG